MTKAHNIVNELFFFVTRHTHISCPSYCRNCCIKEEVVGPIEIYHVMCYLLLLFLNRSSVKSNSSSIAPTQMRNLHVLRILNALVALAYTGNMQVYLAQTTKFTAVILIENKLWFLKICKSANGEPCIGFIFS